VRATTITTTITTAIAAPMFATIVDPELFARDRMSRTDGFDGVL
jgi:hypothetical protein